MRNELCKVLVERAPHEDFVFLTGDLGFMALEPLRDAMGARFINAGVAEQNMISVAAALAWEGFDVWVYSIAPFLYARALEQIRNDVAFHGLPVKLVGNGGGYGYGVMGATHHALEDYGVLLTLPDMKIIAPAFDDDIAEAVARLGRYTGPSYLRLGRDELPQSAAAPVYAPWRRLLAGSGPIVVAFGPIAGAALEVLSGLAEDERPDLWALCELPLSEGELPETLIERVRESGRLCVIEEHVAQGGAGAALCQWAAETGLPLTGYRHLRARGYPSGRFGSQSFHRRESGLDADGIRAAVRELAA